MHTITVHELSRWQTDRQTQKTYKRALLKTMQRRYLCFAELLVSFVLLFLDVRLTDIDGTKGWVDLDIRNNVDLTSLLLIGWKIVGPIIFNVNWVFIKSTNYGKNTRLRRLFPVQGSRWKSSIWSGSRWNWKTKWRLLTTSWPVERRYNWSRQCVEVHSIFAAVMSLQWLHVYNRFMPSTHGTPPTRRNCFVALASAVCIRL